MARVTVGVGGDGVPESVAFLVSRIGYQVVSQLAAGLAPLGIEPRDFGLLQTVARADDASQRAIGQALGIPPSRMVSLIDDLEARGLVCRRPHPRDRRAHALLLTPAGKRLLGKAVEVAAGVEKSLCSDLAPVERERLLSLLARLAGTQPGHPGVHPGLAAPGRRPSGTPGVLPATTAAAAAESG